ncbi:hypothetical protein Harman_39060 [Haloarcula mannanilytica]|uniref:Uncharacterized protein n=1 Tax=Haloarcula mannanilytica TaxID=2509225 RepID=A0A4C2EN72_9EURY|nr:hypothetical protein Harman_39060 [Haloarcula mannanilytica]
MSPHDSTCTGNGVAKTFGGVFGTAFLLGNRDEAVAVSAPTDASIGFVPHAHRSTEGGQRCVSDDQTFPVLTCGKHLFPDTANESYY